MSTPNSRKLQLHSFETPSSEMAPMPKPAWCLTGSTVLRPNGEPAPLTQSAWTVTDRGWTSLVTIGAAPNTPPGSQTVQLFVSHVLPAEVAAALATSLIGLRLRAAEDDAPIHLGDIHVR